MYLSYEERQRFDSPPILTNIQPTIFIQLPDWAESYYKVLITPINQVGFLLQLAGPVRIFPDNLPVFDPLQFRPDDTGFIQKTGRSIDRNAVDMLTYKQSRSYYRHQQEILSHLGFESFSNQDHVVLIKEAKGFGSFTGKTCEYSRFLHDVPARKAYRNNFVYYYA